MLDDARDDRDMLEPDDLETADGLASSQGLGFSDGLDWRTPRTLKDAAAKLDIQLALRESVRKLRRRLPGDENFGDPLSIAGDAPVEWFARGVSAVVPDRESLLGELGFASLQIWQSIAEATGRNPRDTEMALLFTDLVGFSSWALAAGDGTSLELLRQVTIAIEVAVAAHGGRIVKRLGDGLMASFVDAQAAVEAALDAQAAVQEIELDGYRPRMRAGVHWGRPRRLGGDYLGVDVNIAARVGDAAKPDQVLVSGSALDRIEVQDLRVGRQKRLRAEGAPRDTHVAPVSRTRSR